MNINTLPNPLLVKELYGSYFQSQGKYGEVYSSHWQKYSKKISVAINEEGILTAYQGCGFGDLQYVRFLTRMLNIACNFSYWVRMGDKAQMLALMRSGKRLLTKCGLYLSYDCFRQIAALRVIQKYFKVQARDVFDVLIIGDGYGFLSAMIKDCYPNARVTLIDIGEVLIFQAINLGMIYPSLKHSFIGQNTAEDFAYIPADKIPSQLGKTYRLVINTSSMQEMNYETVAKYFDLIRKNVCIDNLFYCCNRVFKKLPGGEESEFLRYPWLSWDLHYVDEEPKFYRYYISGRFPFLRYFDGKMHHRLTKMKINQVIFQKTA